MYNSGKLVAAICAAPIVLSAAGITDDKEVTSYPGLIKKLIIKNYNSDKAVVIDKKCNYCTRTSCSYIIRI